jgi:hypothetical protein
MRIRIKTTAPYSIGTRYRRYHPAGMAKIPTGVFDLDTDGSSWTNLDPDKFFQIPDDSI